MLLVFLFFFSSRDLENEISGMVKNKKEKRKISPTGERPVFGIVLWRLLFSTNCFKIFIGSQSKFFFLFHFSFWLVYLLLSLSNIPPSPSSPSSPSYPFCHIYPPLSPPLSPYAFFGSNTPFTQLAPSFPLFSFTIPKYFFHPSPSTTPANTPAAAPAPSSPNKETNDTWSSTRGATHILPSGEEISKRGRKKVRKEAGRTSLKRKWWSGEGEGWVASRSQSV